MSRACGTEPLQLPQLQLVFATGVLSHIYWTPFCLSKPELATFIAEHIVQVETEPSSFRVTWFIDKYTGTLRQIDHQRR